MLRRALFVRRVYHSPVQAPAKLGQQRCRVEPVELNDIGQNMGDDLGFQVQQIVQHMILAGVGKIDQADVADLRFDQDIFQVEIAVDGGDVDAAGLVEQLRQGIQRVGQPDLL